jgi:hypothetical protein
MATEPATCVNTLSTASIESGDFVSPSGTVSDIVLGYLSAQLRDDDPDRQDLLSLAQQLLEKND